MNEPKPRGYCPGVWTPMPSGDGLIVRVRPRQARMPARALAVLAESSRASGNGIIELTRRGNLQVRGVSGSSWPGLRDDLVALRLAGDAPQSEAHASLFACPLSGLDPRCPPLEALADALLAVLSGADRPLLPDKFAVVLGGGSRSSSELTADVHVRLHPAHPDRAELLLSGKADDATSLGTCRASEAPEALRALLAALAAYPTERRRMRDAVAADLASLRGAVRHVMSGGPRREPAWGAPEAGYHTGQLNWFGYGLPFGSASAEAWGALARLAERHGSGEVRFTPTRHVLVPGVRPEDREALVEFGQRHAFEVRPPAPGLELVACSGSPACGSAHGETRELARAIGKLLGGRSRIGATLHVSGCGKSCARDEAADITLVHGADGLRVGFGRDVQSTLLTRPLSVEGVLEHVVERFVRAPARLAAAGKSNP